MNILQRMSRLFMVFGILIPTLSGAGDYKFTDLTGSKYSGKEENLQGFGIGEIELQLQDKAYLTDKQMLVWAINNRRPQKNGFETKVKSYTIHFQIKDRTGKILRNETGKFNREIRGKGLGLVQIGDGSHYLHLANRIDIPYAQIDYWVSDLEWVDEKVIQEQSDRVAFTLEEQMNAVNDTKKKKQNTAKALIVSFTRPEKSIQTFKLDKFEGYLLRGEEQISSIHFSDSWISMLEKVAKSEGYSESFEEKVAEYKAGKIGQDEKSLAKCNSLGCVVIFSKRYTYPSPNSHGGLGSSDTDPCNEVWNVVTGIECEAGKGLFAKDKCQKVALKCKRLYPWSAGQQIQPGSESLIFIYPSLSADKDRFKFQVGGQVLEEN